jgi:amino acid transporter
MEKGRAATPFSRVRKVLPFAVSASLLAWLLGRIPLPELTEAFRRLSWGPLVAITVALVCVAFFWDSLCIWSLFNDRDRPLKYRTALRARGATYLFFILNFGLVMILRILPADATRRLRQSRLGAEIVAAGLSWRRTASLFLLRSIYFSLAM